MSKSHIYYIANYYVADNAEKLDVSPAAKKKVDSIIEFLKGEAGVLEIISPSVTISNKGKIKYFECEINKNCIYKQFASRGTNNKYIRRMQKILNQFKLLLFLFGKISKNDIVIVYHVYDFMLPIMIVNKIKKYKLVLEVEEIFRNWKTSYPKIYSNNENKYFDLADGYIFSTDELNKLVNRRCKPYITINGAYQPEKKQYNKFSDRRIHCFYSGTFDLKKGGAKIAIETASYLDENYIIHLTGYGNDEEIEQIRMMVTHANRNNKCQIAFEGFLDEIHYMKLLQSCDLGLNTQTPNEKFSDTCFPSKILVYMANGLRVLSSKSEAVIKSDVGKYLFYYDEQKPKIIAEAIRRIDFSLPYDSRKILEQLEKNTKVKFNNFIKTIYNNNF